MQCFQICGIYIYVCEWLKIINIPEWNLHKVLASSSPLVAGECK